MPHVRLTIAPKAAAADEQGRKPSRAVVAVVFDDKGTVTEIRRFNQKDGKDIEVVERETPTRGKELTFARALLGTLGILGRDSLNSGGGYTKEGK